MVGAVSLAGQLSSKLNRTQLQRLATITGAALTGTKPQLADSISQAAFSWRPPTSAAGTAELRVLSIDMGIRNLAFAFLVSKVSSGTEKSVQISKPQLTTWKRLDLTGDGLNLCVYGTSIAERQKVASEVSSAASSSQPFEPSEMAQQAYEFVKYCSSMQPSHILIERQRFRSGGHSAVQEWSLRVGMFEAMLHAIFRTLRAEHVLNGVAVESVLPMRVNKFWFRDMDVAATGKLAKEAKIQLVRQMLARKDASESSMAVSLDLAAKLEDFVTTGGRKRPTKSNASTPGKAKLDDMSDCLLQGLAWLEWQRNRSLLLRDGLKSTALEI